MIYVSDKAKEKVDQLRRDAQLTDDYFLRVSVVGGGCSGLSYKLDFDNEAQPKDQQLRGRALRRHHRQQGPDVLGRWHGTG